MPAPCNPTFIQSFRGISNYCSVPPLPWTWPLSCSLTHIACLCFFLLTSQTVYSRFPFGNCSFSLRVLCLVLFSSCSMLSTRASLSVSPLIPVPHIHLWLPNSYLWHKPDFPRLGVLAACWASASYLVNLSFQLMSMWETANVQLGAVHSLSALLTQQQGRLSVHWACQALPQLLAFPHCIPSPRNPVLKHHLLRKTFLA